MLIVISEKNPSNLTVKKVKASDVVNYLQPPQPQPTTAGLIAPPANPMKTHLDSMGIVQVFARTDLSEQDYKQYLDTVPPGSLLTVAWINRIIASFHFILGLTAFVWEQAKKEQPKPQMLLPVPLIGVKGKRIVDRKTATLLIVVLSSSTT